MKKGENWDSIVLEASKPIHSNDLPEQDHAFQRALPTVDRFFKCHTQCGISHSNHIVVSYERDLQTHRHWDTVLICGIITLLSGSCDITINIWRHYFWKFSYTYMYVCTYTYMYIHIYMHIYKFWKTVTSH